MKHVFIFLLCCCIGCVVTLLLVKKSTISEPQKVNAPVITSKFSLAHAPKDAVVGIMRSLSGEVLWQSRTASTPARLTALQPVQQGEELVTDSGKTTVTFPNTASVSIQSNSDIQFSQTLPDAFVCDQIAGTAIYTTGGASPISVRSLSLLISLTNGAMAVTTDTDENTVTVEITKGTATVAYNNIDVVSTLQSLSPGDTFLYDDTAHDGTVE